MRPVRRRQRGFNLIQVIFTVAIVGILMALAVPSFQSMLYNGRRTAAVNELVGALHFARGEALKRGQVVSVCPSVSANSCTVGVQTSSPSCLCSTTTTHWTTGWVVFVDDNSDGDVDATDGNGQVNEGESVLQHMTNDQIGISIGSDVTRFSLRPFNVSATAGLLTVCDPRGSGTPTERRGIRVDTRGRTQLVAGDSSGAVTIDTGSVTLACP